MNLITRLLNYADNAGGVYSFGNIETIPFNHWRADCIWLVLIIDPPTDLAFVTVSAKLAKEACAKALIEYQNSLEEDDKKDWEE